MNFQKPYTTVLRSALGLGALCSALIAYGANQVAPVNNLQIAPSVRSQVGPSRVSEPSEYRSSQILVTDTDTNLTYNADVNALVRYPIDGDGPFPVVLYLHGRHVTCSYAGVEFLSTGECDLETPGVLGQPTRLIKPVDSFKGYDYMARNLASNGYVVISINANDINDKDTAGNAGVNERSQLILHHLDILREINKNGFYSAMDKPYLLASLRGKIDMSRIGVMGHSRGGQGVTHVLSVNKNRGNTIELGNIYPAGSEFNKPHNIRAVFALAPTNFDYIAAPDVDFAVLLPYCDGDVSNLQGAFMYDKSRYLTETKEGNKYQVVTMGANHNFYNTTWTGDDYSNADPYCSTSAATTGRDNPLDQRRHGEFLMSSFFRLHLGGEMQFKSWWDGNASLPADACPSATASAGKRCDDRVHLSIQKPASKRLVIDDTLDNGSLTSNNLSGANTASSLDRFEFCNTTSATGTVASAACPSLRTWATAGQLYLDSDDAVSGLTFNIGTKNVKNFDSFTFRAGIPVLTTANGALTSSPDVRVVLTDSAGVSKSVKAANYSRALYLPPGDVANTEGAKTLLNMVKVPLTAFAGVDFEKIQSVKLESAGVSKLQITDVQFQQIGGKLVLPPPVVTEPGGGGSGGTGGNTGGAGNMGGIGNTGGTGNTGNIGNSGTGTGNTNTGGGDPAPTDGGATGSNTGGSGSGSVDSTDSGTAPNGGSTTTPAEVNPSADSSIGAQEGGGGGSLGLLGLFGLIACVATLRRQGQQRLIVSPRNGYKK